MEKATSESFEGTEKPPLEKGIKKGAELSFSAPFFVF